MFILTGLGDIVVGVACGAFVWFYKERIQGLVLGAHVLAAKLHAKADAIAAAVKPKA